MSFVCNLCPRKCNSIRREEKGNGFCKMPNTLVVSKACLHFGEEPCISGKKGSGTIFFSGCNLRCVYCQNSVISKENFGKQITPKRLAEIFYELEQLGANNINLVTPTHYVNQIADAINIYNPKIPIVYNSSGYESEETLQIIKDFVDVYLLDFKYFSDQRALMYSGVKNYVESAKKAILFAKDQVEGQCIYNNKRIMQKGLIVRHLLLPQGTNDAINIIDWCNENVPFAVFSLLSQYFPMNDLTNFKEINRKITQREYNKVLDYISKANFSEIYIQNVSSATDEYIPDFDLSGV